MRPAVVAKPASAQPAWIWALRIAVAIALVITAMDFAQSVAATPDGGYDAAAIWNIRARYLAGGPASWHFAVSDQTGTNHPGYPLLVSGFIARTWVILGDLRSSTPAALSGMFALSAVALLAGSVAQLAGEALGWLAALVLMATEGFVSQASIQYADIPLSFFALAAVALLAIASRREWPPGVLALAGFCAGGAVWTKNEGIPFALFFCVAAVWAGRVRAIRWVAAGLLPLLLLTFVYKAMLVDGREQMFPATTGVAIKMIADPARWSEIIASFARNFWELGFPWAHPFLLIAIAAWAFGFVADARSRVWIFLAPLGLLAADFGIYLITQSGLTWHLGTSNNRVIVQVWPALLFGFFLLLREPKAELPKPKKR
jgi:hypothetical protein